MTLFSFFTVFVLQTIALSLIMAGAWLAWSRTGNSGWVDTVWTFGLGAVGLVSALLSGLVGNYEPRAWLVAGLIGFWALRLGIHIARRTSGITDDPRYAKLTEGWGDNASSQMFVLLQKQAWVSIPLALSMFLAAANPAPGLRLQDMIGALCLLIAIGGEALADAQLKAFRNEPTNKGKVCRVGLWSWSRHPNYFFEWLGWLAYPILAIDLSGAYPWGFIAVVGPVCMYWLLVHVSGIPPLEEHMLERRGQAFRDYQRTTSAFFPAPPRRAAEAA